MGGFATVWLYYDDELQSPVAVKALADNWAQRSDVRERFIEEARILRRADSDHVVRVYDIGDTGETPYFVMAYADQGTVADLIEAEGQVAPERTNEIVSQAGIGLEVLHQHGVIHRDVKPQNLLLRSTPDGGSAVMVADLGVAKAMLHASGLTQVVGTPAYMAPEQAVGLGVDERADVHALGAVAYHLLTGTLVRQGSESLAAAALPTPPSQLVALPGVDRVLLRALDPDPERRWPDIGSFTDALHASLDGVGSVTPAHQRMEAPPAVDEPQPIDRAARPKATRPRRVVLLAVVVLLVAFAGSFAVVSLIIG